MKLIHSFTVAVLATTMAIAQETGIRVRIVRVLATDQEAIATFYEKAFGMSEIRRPAKSEIVLNFGSTVEGAKSSPTTPIVIAARPKDAPAGALASLVLQVPDLNKAVEMGKAAGATVFRAPFKAGASGDVAFLKDPDGNQIELVQPPAPDK